MRASRRIISDTVGASVGQAIAASFTIARVQNRTVNRGANAKSLFGGNRKSGPALTFRISRQANPPIIDREATKVVLMVNAATRPSSCTKTALAGCTFRKVYKTAHSRRITSRWIRPMNLNGKTVHQVAVPFHFGAAGPLRGNAANNLVAISGEPNVTIMESKALVCNIIPGRLPRGPAFLDWLERNAPQAGQPPNLHPEQPPLGAPSGGRFSRSHGKEGKTV